MRVRGAGPQRAVIPEFFWNRSDWLGFSVLLPAPLKKTLSCVLF